MTSLSSCKCLHCREFFLPSPNNRRIQRYCSKAECRKASRAAAQAKWLKKPANCCYFRGPENVERVRAWRERHPGYWRKKRPALQALQDLAPTQVTEEELVRVHEEEVSRGAYAGLKHSRSSSSAALQDLAGVQVPLLAGVVSLLIGDALQDRFAVFARELVDRGKRVLATER